MISEHPFGGVRAAFERNFIEGLELGAALAVFIDGKCVVDLWGGFATPARRQPVSGDTLFSVFSVSKGAAATVIARLVDKGALSYDQPVAGYWPEFAEAGKGAITVGQIMSHQAGLCGVREPVGIEDFYGHSRVAELLSRQLPLFPAGSGWGYHTLTFGVLADELVRRVDGRTLSCYFDREIARPFGIDLHFELPQSQLGRHAQVTVPGPPAEFPGIKSEAYRLAYENPLIDVEWSNTSDWLAAGLPAAGASASARGIATLYATLIEGPLSLLSRAALEQATSERIAGESLTTGRYARYAAGFSLNTNALFGPHPDSFGHAGLGGSLGFADPEAGLALGYVTNRMIMPAQGVADPRVERLIGAVYGALRRQDTDARPHR
jgi:CubicO group peptidase (beta-lactamase class C family)